VTPKGLAWRGIPASEPVAPLVSGRQNTKLMAFLFGTLSDRSVKPTHRYAQRSQNGGDSAKRHVTEHFAVTVHSRLHVTHPDLAISHPK
jgi:hypothetical protein